MTQAKESEVLAGQAVYSKTTLAIYDLLVLGLSNRLIWRCPTPLLLELYNQRVSANHLDLGVGTGYFLDRCRFPAQPRVVLVDLNANSLEATTQRISRYQPVSYRRNVLEDFAFEEKHFDSVGVNYLLHCMPGDIRAKAIVFDHIDRYLNPGGIVFGSTLLQGGVQRNAVAKRLMKIYNGKGIFGNESDSLEDLRNELARRFHDSNVRVVGCAALFWARKSAEAGREASDSSPNTGALAQ